ncbi:MAG: hypothetical protein FJZ69_07000 [Bacteroidetes bacterium]|nr:hypothetical protein [Bacteroidota bacterium]
MRKNLYLQVAALTGLLALSIVACQKEKSATQDPEEQYEMTVSKLSSESDAEAEIIYDNIFDDVMGASDEVGLYGSGIFGREYGLDTAQRCFTVRVDRPNAPRPFPVIITVRFPQSGCMGPDGRVRRGEIKTVYTNRLMIPGAESVTTFLNYSVDSVTVGGTYKIKNIVDPVQIMIFPPQYNHKWLVTVVGGRLGYPNGSLVEWNSTKTIEQIEGSHTPILRDDVFKITGNADGVGVRGSITTRWLSEIIDPLIRKNICRWIVKGKIRTVRRNLSNTSPWVAVLDFGRGTCDNAATITINGVTYNITLR